jgi:hypothetical protein
MIGQLHPNVSIVVLAEIYKDSLRCWRSLLVARKGLAKVQELRLVISVLRFQCHLSVVEKMLVVEKSLQ